jgi:hypothetical protein
MELVYCEECADLKAARKREREIKAYSGVQFKALLESCSAERDCTGKPVPSSNPSPSATYLQNRLQSFLPQYV